MLSCIPSLGLRFTLFFPFAFAQTLAKFWSFSPPLVPFAGMIDFCLTIIRFFWEWRHLYYGLLFLLASLSDWPCRPIPATNGQCNRRLQWRKFVQWRALWDYVPVSPDASGSQLDCLLDSRKYSLHGSCLSRILFIWVKYYKGSLLTSPNYFGLKLECAIDSYSHWR